MKVTRLIAVLTVSLLVAAAALGCSALRKPQAGQGKPPAPTAPAPGTPLPTNPTESSRLAQMLSAEAQKVKGVDKATVVLTGSTAMVGASIKPGSDASTVKTQVGDAIKKADGRVKNVLVSTDPELNQRLIRISQGLAGGRPISAFSTEIQEILKRLSPSAK